MDGVPQIPLPWDISNPQANPVPIAPSNDYLSQITAPQTTAAPTQVPPGLQHINDVIGEYSANKADQADTNDTVSQILSQRFQPTMGDIATAGLRETQSYASPQGFRPVTPGEIMDQRYTQELSPYTTGLGLLDTQSKIGLQGAQATALNNQLGRTIAEKQFEYANDPAMAMQRAMANYMQGLGGPQPTGNPQQSGQPSFNPMGAMLAKQFGMENMQIGANGQPQLIPGVVSPGQKEQDSNFAQSWQTYANAGGAKRTQNAIDIVDKTIDDLQSGKLQTGGMMSPFALNTEGQPDLLGKLTNRDVLVARGNIASAILPQAKALFGARVTNFDAQSLINSQGLDPLADVKTNIMKLQNLKSALLSGQKDLQNSGQYFVNHGTLAGYQPDSTSEDNGGIKSVGGDIQDGTTATNQQTGQKIIFKNGQWGPL